jgi:alpha-L-rhamnosidase
MKSLLILFTSISVLLLASGSAEAKVALTNLRCEYRTNPLGVETPQPRLGWVITSKERGLRQTAYQILVASSPELLKQNRGDLWDSGKVHSDESVQVVYGGQAPTSGQACFWKVRVWNQADEISAWSQPAQWTMGLLKESDWQAKWIGFQPTTADQDKLAALLSLDGNHWVWAAGATEKDQPREKVYFRKVIELPANQTVRDAEFLLTADDILQLYVNGKAVGSRHSNWKQLTTRSFAEHLRPGANVIAIEAENTGVNPAGLVGRAAIVFADGTTLSVPIDRSWVSSKKETANWNGLEFAATDWQPAAEVVKFGDKPWDRPEHFVMKPAPHFRKSFAVSKPVKRATVFASALGVYELQLNGKPVSDDVLSPGWTDYSKRVHYFAYDVTAQLRRGENVVGAILGDGWYASYLVFTGKRNYYGGDPRLLAQLEIEYRDGTKEIVGTDASWKAAPGPIREADLLMGCVYDARLEMPGWSRVGFDDGNWAAAQVDAKVKARLMAHPGEPMRHTQEIRAVSVKEPKPGVYVFDLGQNLVGWARLKLKGSAGQKVVVRHAEMLNPDGTIYTTNLRAAKATDTFYLAGGGKRDYEPYFTFHGFQYVEVTGLDYKPSAGDVVGIVVHSDLPRTGSFECSEPLVNKLTQNSVWGQRGNFLDVPTDCPQRDERAGWTGDVQVFMKTSCLNMDSPAFYTKWLADLCEDTQHANGGFGDVAPHINLVGFGNTGWSDAGPICNWLMYEMYGDTRVLARHYASLERHMEYLANTSTNFVRGTGAYGDWLRLSGPQHSEVIGTAYYFYTTRTMIKIANALGRTADVAKYEKLADQIRAVFVKNFLKEDGRILDGKNETGQTFYALAFGLDLVPAEMKSKAAAQFAGVLKAQNDHIATGFLGTPMVLFALQKAGHPELAYKLVLNKTYPGWLQQVIWGSTTMWERWDGWRPDKGFQDPGMNSFNHYWLGCVSEWLFTQAAGIDTDGPGFKRIVVKPELVKPEQGFSWVKASYNSIRGPVASAWKIDGNGFQLDVTVPGNSVATIYVPAESVQSVTEGGKALERVPGLKVLRHEAGRAVLEVGSGRYEFKSQLPDKFAL